MFGSKNTINILLVVEDIICHNHLHSKSMVRKGRTILDIRVYHGRVRHDKPIGLYHYSADGVTENSESKNLLTHYYLPICRYTDCICVQMFKHAG